MWYSGKNRQIQNQPDFELASGAIGVATSNDGIKWEPLAGDETAGAVLAPNDDWWAFDTLHVGVGDVHVMSNQVVKNSMGLYWMYYFGGDESEPTLGGSNGTAPPGSRMCIGVALSNDGIHWGRVEGEYASGAILEPREGEVFVGWPQVVQASSSPDLWYMYFHVLCKETRRFKVGCAQSKNCVEWQRLDAYIFEPALSDGAFDAGGVSARCVLRDGDEWLMYYEAINLMGTHSIGLARSRDGIGWTRTDKPVLEPSADPSSWDAKAVSRPWVVPCGDGSAMLYYVGRSVSGVQAIGAAQSDGANWASFSKCTN